MAPNPRPGRPIWLEAGFARAPAWAVGDRQGWIVAWRIAGGWRGRGGAAMAAAVWPVAVLTQEPGGTRRLLVPNLTLAASLLALGLSALLLGWPRRRRLPHTSGGSR